MFMLYKMPKLDVSQVWSKHLKKLKELIEKVQRRATSM